MSDDPTDKSPRCPTCGYRLHGLMQKRCPECGKEFRSPERWWRAVLGADASRSDREAIRGERGLAILGGVLMVAGLALWWLSPPYEHSGSMGLGARSRFELDGMIAILTAAALWYRREIDESTYPVWIIAGVVWLLYGGFFYLFA